MIVLEKCPLCNSKQIFKLSQVFTAPIMTIDINGEDVNMLTISQFDLCYDCRIVFQNPRMTDGWYKNFYESGFYRKTLGISQQDMDNDEKRRAKDIMAYLEPMRLEIKCHKDIGSSRGYFLRMTHDHYGCKVTGDEPNSNYGMMAYDDDPGKADLLSAIHVLEHTTDPQDELDSWASQTRRYMLIEVPGENCKGGPLRFAHLWYFPPDLLRRMIEKTGMTVIDYVDGDNTRILAEWRK